MKTFSKTITSISLSLLTVGVFGQTNLMPVSAHFALRNHKMKGNPALSLTHKINSTPGRYAFLDYVYTDSNFSNTQSYNEYYGQEINMRYTINDTGNAAGNYNQFLIQSCTVAFDSLFDANYFIAYPSNTVSNMTVDSIFVLLGHENNSGTTDTIVIQVNSVNTQGIPTSTVLWTDTITTDTGLSANNSWNYIYEVAAAPNISLGSNSKFAVSVQYFGSKLDTMGFLYGYSGFTCNTNSNSLADTTQFGAYPISTKYPIRANSFTTGYSYYATPPGSAIYTFPQASAGEGIYYPCSNPSNGVLYWQDIAMFAEVSFNSTLGINNLTPSGLSVGQNYPNPFNQQTQITYSLTQSSNVTFTVYDITGRVIMTNNYSTVSPGQHEINLSANSFSPGIYFYTFNVNGSIVTKKMVITD